MRNANGVIAGLLAMVALVVLFSAVYVVEEWQQVVVTRFGEPVGEPITTPGLKLKVPVFDRIHRFDHRFLEWDGRVTQVPTREKRFILVDTYARWRITDPLQFFKRLRDEEGAQLRLDGIINGETRDAVARHDLVELVRTSNREPAVVQAEIAGEEPSILEPIEYGREKVRLEILRTAQERVADLGIEILDVRFKRINYVEEVQRSVYERMIAERRRIADRFRSEGEGEASRILGEKERELLRIQSEAFRQAEIIRGAADAEATQIYAQAYGQSREAAEFYRFLRSMETLAATIDADTSLVLSTEGEFYRYLDGAQ